MAIENEANSEGEELLKALLLDTLRHRQTNGEITTLRDLHRILEVPQPTALRAARQLENEGAAIIEDNISDAFASVVKVSHSVMQKMEIARRSFLGRAS